MQCYLLWPGKAIVLHTACYRRWKLSFSFNMEVMIDTLFIIVSIPIIFLILIFSLSRLTVYYSRFSSSCFLNFYLRFSSLSILVFLDSYLLNSQL